MEALHCFYDDDVSEIFVYSKAKVLRQQSYSQRIEIWKLVRYSVWCVASPSPRRRRFAVQLTLGPVTVLEHYSALGINI